MRKLAFNFAVFFAVGLVGAGHLSSASAVGPQASAVHPMDLGRGSAVDGVEGGQLAEPTTDSEWESGSPIPIVVNDLASWYVVVWCDGEMKATLRSAMDSSFTVENPSTQDAMSCGVHLWEVRDGRFIELHAVHIVVKPAVRLPNEVKRLRADHAKFYPLVRDGYKDAVMFTLRIRMDAELWMYIRDTDGRLVKSRKVHSGAEWWPGYARNTVIWSGRNSDKRLVKAGRYRVTFESKGAHVETARAHIRVTVA